MWSIALFVTVMLGSVRTSMIYESGKANVIVFRIASFTLQYFLLLLGVCCVLQGHFFLYVLSLNLLYNHVDSRSFHIIVTCNVSIYAIKSKININIAGKLTNLLKVDDYGVDR